MNSAVAHAMSCCQQPCMRNKAVIGVFMLQLIKPLVVKVVVLQCSVGSLWPTVSMSILLKVGSLGWYRSYFTPASLAECGRLRKLTLFAILAQDPTQLR